MRGAAGNGLGSMIKYLKRTTSGAAGNGLGTMRNFSTCDAQRAAPWEHDQYLRRTTSAAAGNGLGTAIKYLRGAAGIGLARHRDQVIVKGALPGGISYSCADEHSEKTRAPHTNGPRNVPRCGALSLLQKPLKYPN
jgi:hypothetical protein